MTEAAGDPRRRGLHARRAVRIGITGPIGCGKSQVARWLAELGAAVIDADEVARAVTAPGEPAHDAVVRHFGPAVTAPDGTLDRAALGARRVRGSGQAPGARGDRPPGGPAPNPGRAWRRADAAGAPAVVVEAIKLVEGGLASLCDEVWLVTCDAGSQRERILARGTPADDADRRIAAQAGLAERLAPAATRVIDTSGDAAGTRETVEALFRAAVSSSA